MRTVCICTELRYRARSLRAHIEAFRADFQSGFAAGEYVEYLTINAYTDKWL